MSAPVTAVRTFEVDVGIGIPLRVLDINAAREIAALLEGVHELRRRRTDESRVDFSDSE